MRKRGRQVGDEQAETFALPAACKRQLMAKRCHPGPGLITTATPLILLKNSEVAARSFQ
jgi:hypothetical protein